MPVCFFHFTRNAFFFAMILPLMDVAFGTVTFPEFESSSVLFPPFFSSSISSCALVLIWSMTDFAAASARLTPASFVAASIAAFPAAIAAASSIFCASL